MIRPMRVRAGSLIDMMAAFLVVSGWWALLAAALFWGSSR